MSNDTHRYDVVAPDDNVAESRLVAHRVGKPQVEVLIERHEVARELLSRLQADQHILANALLKKLLWQFNFHYSLYTLYIITTAA